MYIYPIKQKLSDFSASENRFIQANPDLEIFAIRQRLENILN